MDFGMAINALKQGKKVTRRIWGEDDFIWMKPATNVKAEWCHDPELKRLAESRGGEIPALATICAYYTNGPVFTGWIATSADMLAEDWELYESE